MSRCLPTEEVVQLSRAICSLWRSKAQEKKTYFLHSSYIGKSMHSNREFGFGKSLPLIRPPQYIFCFNSQTLIVHFDENEDTCSMLISAADGTISPPLQRTGAIQYIHVCMSTCNIPSLLHCKQVQWSGQQMTPYNHQFCIGLDQSQPKPPQENKVTSILSKAINQC